MVFRKNLDILSGSLEAPYIYSGRGAPSRSIDVPNYTIYYSGILFTFYYSAIF